MKKAVDHLSAFEAMLPAHACLTHMHDKQPFESDWRGTSKGHALCILFPTLTKHVQDIVVYCKQHSISYIPQGGNTGLVQGTVPSEDGTQIIINLSRMKQIRHLDKENFSVTVEAGMILGTLKAALEEHHLFFPISLGSEGSCQIGGIIATNAGGHNALRYGNTRDHVLGLEIVLPDGSLMEHLSPLRKDNTGYDLKNLLIGSEGTLAIITAASLKLSPLSKQQHAAFIGLKSFDHVIALFTYFKHHLSEYLDAFEYIPSFFLDLVITHIPNHTSPLQGTYQHYILLELASSSDPKTLDLHHALEEALAHAFEQEIINDAVLSESMSQRNTLWSLRDHLSEASKKAMKAIYFDVSMPISQIVPTVYALESALEAFMPGIIMSYFGHIGDGNLHLHIAHPGKDERIHAISQEVKKIVYDIIYEHQGSFSAEHGIGGYRQNELCTYKSAHVNALLKSIKQLFDPCNLCNPSKVVRL